MLESVRDEPFDPVCNQQIVSIIWTLLQFEYDHEAIPRLQAPMDVRAVIGGGAFLYQNFTI